MTAGRFAIVLLLALLGVAGAFWLSLQRHLPRDTAFGPVALSGLAGELTLVDRIVITGNDHRQVTLERRGETFAVAEFDGYPADRKRVQTLLAALADLRLAAADAGHGAVDDTATTVELTGRLAPRRVRIGRSAGPDTYSVTIEPTGATGVAGPLPPLDTEADHWLSSPLLDIADSEVHRLVYTADTAPLVVERASPGEPFAWSGSRAGTPTPPAVAASPATLAAALPVLGARRLAASTPFVARTAVETFSGLRVEFAGHVSDGRHWLRFAASVVPATNPSGDDQERARRLAARLQAIGAAFEVDVPAERFASLLPGTE
jgi:hypothetical protein